MILNQYLRLALLIFPLLLTNCRTETSSSPDETVISDGPELIQSRLRAEPDGLMPFNTSKGYALEVAKIIFPMLVDIDKKTYDLAPVLCKTLPILEKPAEGPYKGGFKLTYEILDEAVWDNGTPVTAKDYEFTLKTIFNPKSKGLFRLYKGLYTFIENMEIDENNPKIFSLYGSESNFKLIENASGWILPAYHYDPDGLLKDFALTDLMNDDWVGQQSEESLEKLEKFGALIVSPEYALQPDKIVSCGAYRVAEWIPTEKLIIEKKDNWWGEGLYEKYSMLSAFPKSISYSFVPNDNAAIAMLKNGELDVMGTVEGNIFSDLQENAMLKDKYEFITPVTDNINYIGINNANPKLSDVKVRKALSYLLDRNKISEVSYNGYATPIYSPLPLTSKFYEPNKTDFDLSKAITLLEEAGWKDEDGNGVREKTIDGKTVPLTLTIRSTVNNIISESAIRIIIESGKRAGIDFQNLATDTRAYFKARRAGDFELFMGSMSPPPTLYDPAQYWRTDSPGNYYKMGSKEMDEVIDKITMNEDPSQYKYLYSTFQSMFAEMQPVIFMVNSQDRIVVKKGYKNKVISSMSPSYQLAYFR